MEPLVDIMRAAQEFHPEMIRGRTLDNLKKRVQGFSMR
jgi:hypothetical protein